jgi:poly(3-hydroxybutyrate) depolymerase
MIEIHIPEGATFKLCENMGTIENRFYLYSPSHPNMTFGMSPMLNSLVYLYTDQPVNNLDAAWKVLLRAGLLDLAEKEAIFVAIPIPLNEKTWEAADYDAYYNIQYVLSGGHIEFHGPGTSPILQYPRYVYNNKQFAIGEGRGATFVHNILSQKCNRIAGICTFGGDMEPELTGSMPLPAYLVDPCENAVAYYKRVNNVDVQEGNTWYCTDYRLKKIIIQEGGSSMTPDQVLNAWSQIFSRTARVCVDDNIVCSNLSAKIWVLQDWPNYDELGLSIHEHDVDGYICYDVIPADMPEPVPLVISCHGGGDDCLYHINSCGWTNKCAEEKFLLISPDFPSGAGVQAGEAGPLGYPDFRVIADHIKKVLDYARANYNIDNRRVYIAGFSMGSSVTAATALRYLNDFAACCVMGGLGYNNPWYEHHVGAFKAKYDMPFIIISGDEDVMSMDVDYKGNRALFGVHSNGLPINGLDRLLEINKLPYACADYERYPLWGYPVDQTVRREDTGLSYHVGSIFRKDRQPPIAQFITFEGAGHAHSSFFATLCWDFLSQYAREANGVTTELTVNYPRES